MAQLLDYKGSRCRVATDDKATVRVGMSGLHPNGETGEPGVAKGRVDFAIDGKRLEVCPCGHWVSIAAHRYNPPAGQHDQAAETHKVSSKHLGSSKFAALFTP